jgi:DHA2 family multidrug resistance protein
MPIKLARRNGAGEVNPWIIALTVMLATFMEVLDTSVANVALPHIAGSLSASVDEATWVLTSYLVSNAIILPMNAWFSTLMGRKRFYMLCVGIFTVSSLLCGMAPSLFMLIVFRVIQGAGGGALQPVSQAILVESFPREKQGMAMAVYGMGVVFAPVIGPTLGGWITDNFSWRWIFFINLPVGILSLLLTSALITDPPYLIRKGLKDGLKIDYAGLGFLAVGLGSLEIVLDKGQREDWFGSSFIVQFSVIAVACLVALVFWELSRKEPVIDFRILKNRNFAVATITMFLLGFVLYSSTTLLPLLLQTLMGYTALLAGLVLSPGGLVVCACLPLVGVLLRKFEARWLVIVGVVMCSLGLLQMAGFNLYIDYDTALKARIVQSIGLAFLFVPINTMAFYFVPKERTNYATGLVNLARNIGGSSGIATATTLLARRAQYHQQVLISHLTPGSPTYRAALAHAAGYLHIRGAGAPEAAQQAHGLIYGSVVRQASMLAYSDAFWVMGMLFLTIVPFMFLMKKAEPHKATVVME